VDVLSQFPCCFWKCYRNCSKVLYTLFALGFVQISIDQSICTIATHDMVELVGRNGMSTAIHYKDD